MSDPMTPAVPDPTAEALSEAERGQIRAAMRGYAFGPMYDAVESILAARAAAAPDALRKRVGAHRPVMAKPAAIMCACDHEWRDVPSHAAHVCALLEDGAVDGG